MRCENSRKLILIRCENNCKIGATDCDKVDKIFIKLSHTLGGWSKNPHTGVKIQDIHSVTGIKLRLMEIDCTVS